MKKIIATVLAMVMALALCTTAFAAGTTTTDVESKGYSLLDATDNSVITIKGDKFTKTVATENKVSGVTYYFADVYAITIGTDTSATNFYACDSSIATRKLVKGSEVVYLTTVNVNGTDGISKIVDKKIDAVDTAKCDEFQKATDKTTVFVIDNETYWAGGDKYAMLNGKAVSYGEGATAKPHTFANNKTTDTKGNIVAVTCEKCEKTFKAVETIPAAYLGTVAKDENGRIVKFEDKYFILLDEQYAAGTTTNTTTSPKTFDAGIAMYVGMALTSVAGSAVVIGKKKEF